MDIHVGILTAPEIDFERREHTFVLKNVRIGIGFHWDRLEDQEFEGSLSIHYNEDGTQTAINTLDLEDYLTSVISSEMSADSPMELLKAHAVISRSWAIRMIERRAQWLQLPPEEQQKRSGEFHTYFDVCADDHCQRYEGLLRRNNRAVEAVRATADQILTYEGKVADCRYYKCCGGRTEQFETCWEDMHVPYLISVDCPYCAKAIGNSRLLRLVLNNYDQETSDFHDWTVSYTAQQISEIIQRKSGIDFGTILDLRPVRRGTSGRIYELEIVGTKHIETIGKELKIRQWLSNTCLYSSWFDVQKTTSPESEDPALATFILSGHGWGHGVGLCQIGAAEWADEGADYQTILAHYYPGTHLRGLDS